MSLQGNTLEVLRKEFETDANRSISLPLAGAVVWSIIFLAGWMASERAAIMIALFGSGLMFPIGLAIARTRNENITARENPLSRLMGMSVLMVNLLWALHIPLVMYATELFILSLAIGLGLHWIIYSWIVAHPIGLIHALFRTSLALIAWLVFPDHRISAVSFVVVLAYALSIVVMLRRPIPSLVEPNSTDYSSQ